MAGGSQLLYCFLGCTIYIGRPEGVSQKVWPGITTGRAKTRPVASGCSHMDVSCATGDGRKYSGARMQPLTRGPEASDTAASAVHPPYTRLCAS
eukprot:scaffold68775_cov32-Phaeocystis_antarctica.AAC.4